jgi:integrase
VPKLTKRFVDAARPAPNGREMTFWDSDVTGFGLRVQPGGAQSYVLMYRTREGRLRKLTIAKVGKLTPDEARSEAKIKIGEVEKGGDPAGEKVGARKGITVSELCDRYLVESVGKVKESTLDMDKSRIETHVKPLIGRHKVRSLTLTDIERMQNDIASGKTAKAKDKPKPDGAGKKKRKRGGVARGGRGVAGRTVGMLGTILEYAMRLKIIGDNPVRGVKKFKGGKRTTPLHADALKAFGKAMRESADAGENATGLAALRALLLTGCRRNEILALPCAWVDVPNRCIRFGDTKSGEQLRAIGATAATHLKAQIKDEEQAWVFPADRGEGSFVGLPRVLARVCARAELGSVTIHSLRHSFASMAEGLGYSQLTIAGLLGHSVPGVTAIYTHVPDKALREAADSVSAKIAAVLDGKPVKTEGAEVVDISTKRKRNRRG